MSSYSTQFLHHLALLMMTDHLPNNLCHHQIVFIISQSHISKVSKTFVTEAGTLRPDLVAIGNWRELEKEKNWKERRAQR